MKRKSFALSALLGAQSALAQGFSGCTLGWPVVFGPETPDGDTTVTAWAKSRYDGHFAVGGSSRSQNFLETTSAAVDSECSTKGCAFVSAWNQQKGTLSKSWLVNNAYQVLNMASSDNNDNTLIIFERHEANDGNLKKAMIGFLTWEEDEFQADKVEATFQKIGYTIAEHIFEITTMAGFQNLSLLDSNRFYFIGNNPNLVDVTDYYFNLNGYEITSVYKDHLKMDATQVDYEPFAIWTMKHSQGFGWDQNNVIQLASITIPRGQKEMGGPTLLGSDTLYNVIISKRISTASVNGSLSVDTKAYGWEQLSNQNYHYFLQFEEGYETNSSGAKVGDTSKIIVTGANTSSTSLITLTVFELNKDYELEYELSKQYTAEGRVEIMGLRLNYEEDPYLAYVYYKTPTISEDRGRVLKVLLDTTDAPQKYYFQKALEPIQGKYHLQGLHSFRYDAEYPGWVFFSGKTNYIRGKNDLASLELNWTNSNYMFGFMNNYSENNDCRTTSEEKALDYGPGFATSGSSFVNTSGTIRFRIEDVGITAPEPLDMADVDDEDYLDNLEDRDEPYDVTYYDIRNADNSREISMDNWIDSFSQADVSLEDNATNSQALTAYGTIALANSLWAIIQYYTQIKDESSSTLRSSWLVSALIHGGLWIPNLLVWPLTYIGSDAVLDIYVLLSTYDQAGLYGGYFVAWAYLLYSHFGSDNTVSSGTKFANILGETVVSGFSAWIQLTQFEALKQYVDDQKGEEVVEETEDADSEEVKEVDYFFTT